MLAKEVKYAYGCWYKRIKSGARVDAVVMIVLHEKARR